MKRAAIPFGSVLEALGAIDTAPSEESEYWDFFHTRYSTPAGFKAANYLSLSHDCPISEASSFNIARWKALSGNAGYSVIATKRSRHALDLKRTAFTFKAKDATTARDLLFENVVSSFMPREHGEQGQYFIEPDITLPNGSTFPAITYLVQELLGHGNTDTTSESYADILVAPAGQGKTTVAREIARRILDSKSRSIPILVESAQWQNLLNLSLPNVLNAALLQSIPDAVRLTNTKLFQLLVREQLLVPIFDGFDELCLHPHTSYTPTALLGDLLHLVGDTGAKILVTTRETFWETYGAKGLPRRIERLDLRGFSNDQRKRFFVKRLPRADERDTAFRLTREVGERLYEGIVNRSESQSERLSGVPLLLELVALYVEGNPDATFAPTTQDPLGPLLVGVCERENVRQQLQIGADKQMRIFEELFRDYSDDILRTDLAMYVQEFAPGTTQDALARFESHAFFSPGQDVRPRFESLRVYFVARWLANRLEQAIQEPDAVKQASPYLEKNASGNTDVFDFLVQRFAAMEISKAEAAIGHARKMLLAQPRAEGAISALFHLAQRLAFVQQSKKERTQHLFRSLAVSSPIHKLAVFGKLSGLDLCGVEFDECVFRDAQFHNCVFDGSTAFLHTRFEGTIAFENCQGAGLVALVDCSLSDAAEQAWNREAGRASKRLITERVARDALRDILRKFLGQFGFSSIKDGDRKTGPISRNPSREIAWDQLFKEQVIERHHISGVTGGGINISSKPEIRHEVRNFLDNAALGPHLSRVVAAILQTA